MCAKYGVIYHRNKDSVVGREIRPWAKETKESWSIIDKRKVLSSSPKYAVWLRSPHNLLLKGYRRVSLVAFRSMARV